MKNFVHAVTSSRTSHPQAASLSGIDLAVGKLFNITTEDMVEITTTAEGAKESKAALI
jgi:hypothetical protein